MKSIRKSTMVLPEEMIEEILMKIPAGYVWDIRRVCKSWNALITHSQFASKHFERNKNNATSFLLIAFCQRLRRKSLSLFRLNHHPHTLVDINSIAARRLDYFYLRNNFPDFFKELVVAGSINGIVCVSSFCKSITRFLALWNPAINRWKPIPLLPHKKMDHDYSSVGLAFDYLTDDYRIIRLVSVVTDADEPSSRIEMYSVNQDSWLDAATSSPFPYFTTQPNCSVIVKGIPYWSRNYQDFYYPYCEFQSNVIATVDPHTGLYKEISYPQIVTNENTTVHPFNFMDSLAVLIYENSNPKMFRVYALDEKSHGANWINLCTSAPTSLQSTNMCILRCFQDAGKIIVVGWNYDDRRRSFLYNLQTDSLCHTIGMDALRPRWDETYYHVESLVCLDGMEPIQREENINNNECSGLLCLGRDLGPLL